MKMAYLRPVDLIIPLCLLGFIGTGITFLSSVFNPTTRWGILAALSLFLFVSRQRDVVALLRYPLFWAVLVYAAWGLMTVAWSEVPQISLAKSLAFIWVSTTMLIAGYSWAMRHERAQVFDFMWLVAVVALLASLSGQREEAGATGALVYAGLTNNPNFLGFVLAVASAWLMWRVYLVRRQNRRLFALYVGLLTLDLYYLLLSHSRASLLIFLCMAIGLFIGLEKFRKRLPYVLIFSMICATIYYFSPAVQDRLTEYAFKSNLGVLEEAGSGMFYSREEIWEASYDLAMLGGSFGGGYGVTIGEEFHGEIGSSISSGQYGREQGNTQLAILEQTGLVGFGLYLILIAGIFWVCASGLRVARIEVDRVAIGLLGGAIFGLLLQSVFEAWWVAPGAPESATFWLLLGALLGATRRARLAALQSRSSKVMQAQYATAEQSPAGVNP